MTQQIEDNGGVAQLASLIGREGMFTVNVRSLAGKPFKVKVKIQDARRSFGRTDVLIIPKGGEGAAWVDKDSVWLDPK